MDKARLFKWMHMALPSVKKNLICDFEKLPCIFRLMVDMFGASVV